MTSANIMNLGNVDPGSMNGAINGKNKSAFETTASAFASMMQRPEPTVKTGSPEETKVQQTSQTQEFDRYQYRDKTVEEAKVPTVSDKIDSAREDIEEFAQEVVETIKEELGVGEGEIEKAMEDLGMTVFDLLNPQNLAQVVMELNGTQDSAELLLDTDFQSLMGKIGQLGVELMNQLDLETKQMDELISQMDILEASVAMEDAAVTDEATVIAPEEAIAGNPELTEPVADEAAANDTVTVVDDRREIPEDDLDKNPKQSVEQAAPEEEAEPKTDVKRDDSFGRNSHSREGSTEQPVMGQQTDSNVFQTSFGEHISQPVSYAAVDTIDLIRQVADNIRIVLANDETTMELQLNPENLGKVYLNVSAKEGVVNAQITAQNEAVKQALEVQLADLRESLNQSGVKVDSIEITIATHEFERNLEQNQSGQEGDGRGERRQGRRNLDVDSLDELSGLMSEEETLVARMMRDNGNSVDYIA